MTTLKQLILVRHGEAEHQVTGMTGGWTDSPLTPLGRRQATATAKRLAESGFDSSTSLLCSDLRRARETATAICDATGLSAQTHPELRELGNGAAANRTRLDAASLQLPETFPLIDWVPYDQAESWRMMTDRVMGFLDSVAREDRSESLMLVSHANALVAVVHWWLRLVEAHWSTISYDFDCASISELTTNRWGERTITRLNDTAHLQGLK
jgi:broad specificity phosphatase PhoE